LSAALYICKNIFLRLRVGRHGFDSRQGQGFFSPRHGVQTDSKVCPESYPTGTGASFREVKRPGCEAVHSPPPSAKDDNVYSYTSTLLYVVMASCLVKNRDILTYPLSLFNARCGGGRVGGHNFVMLCLQNEKFGRRYLENENHNKKCLFSLWS